MPTPTALPYSMATAEAYVFERVAGPDGVPAMFSDPNFGQIVAFIVGLGVLFGWLRSAGVLKTPGRA